MYVYSLKTRTPISQLISFVVIWDPARWVGKNGKLVIAVYGVIKDDIIIKKINFLNNFKYVIAKSKHKAEALNYLYSTDSALQSSKPVILI